MGYRWYLELAGRFPGRILELGTGTGRILAALLEAGFDAWGIELDQAMAMHGKGKLRARFGPDAAQRLMVGDMRTFVLDSCFELVIVPYNSLCLMDGFGALWKVLDRTAAHFKDEGQLAFDIIVADALPWSKPPYTWSSEGKILEVGGEAIPFSQSGVFAPQTRLHRITQHFSRADGSTQTEHLDLYQWRVGDLERLLAEEGWERAFPPVNDAGEPYGEASTVYAGSFGKVATPDSGS